MPENFKALIYLFIDLIDTIIPVVTSLALLAFVWGLVKFIRSAGAKDQKEGKNLIVWGLVALFVMVSYVGIIRFFQSDLEINNAGGRLHLPGRLPEN